MQHGISEDGFNGWRKFIAGRSWHVRVKCRSHMRALNAYKRLVGLFIIWEIAQREFNVRARWRFGEADVVP